MSKKYFFLCFLILPLQGCTSFSVRINGKVFDNETKMPLVGTTVNLLNGRDIKKTDGNGFFEVFSETKPFQDPTILVTREGFKPFELRIKRKRNETSYIIKSESTYVDFEEPAYPDPNNQETFITGTWIEKWSKEFKTGDTLNIYLEREDIEVEIKRNFNEIRNNK